MKIVCTLEKGALLLEFGLSLVLFLCVGNQQRGHRSHVWCCF